MILFFDTETSGLPDYNKLARDPAQPHIVQLAAMLAREDGSIVESHDVIIRPEGWIIPKEASDVHGITNDVAQIGVPEKLAAQLLFEMVKKARLMVAFNVTFDKFIARIALRRFEIFTDAEDQWWKELPTFCPMRAMTDICAIPSRNGYSGFKFPKLQEAYMTAFGRLPENSHNAANDLLSVKELYFWLKSRGATAASRR